MTKSGISSLRVCEVGVGTTFVLIYLALAVMVAIESFYRHICYVTGEAGKLHGKRNSCWHEINMSWGT